MPDTQPATAITSKRLFDGENWLFNHAVIIAADKITALIPTAELPRDIETLELDEQILAPGLIDIQVNGGGGVMLNNDVSMVAVARICQAHRSCGTTAIMPTLISDTPAAQKAAAIAVEQAIASGENGVLGLHLEGPFFAQDKRGTHSAAMIRTMTDADIQWLSSLQQFPVILTLAPEHVAPEVITALAAAGLLLCAGHTDATYVQVNTAITAGLRGFTHLFNAMRPLATREPGTVGAALDDPSTWAGIIADGHHVHPATIRLAQRLKAPGKLLLVSDAMSTVGTNQTSFELYGERIEESQGRLINAQGRLAGSAISLLDAVRYSHQEVGLELGECLRMASRYPAEFLGLEQKLGCIKPGFRADLIAIEGDFSVSDSWVAGAHQSHSPAQ